MHLTVKSKMGISYLIKKYIFKPKTQTKNIFFKFVYVFINAGTLTFLMFYAK